MQSAKDAVPRCRNTEHDAHARSWPPQIAESIVGIADKVVPIRLKGLPIGSRTGQWMLEASEPQPNTRSCLMATSVGMLVLRKSRFALDVIPRGRQSTIVSKLLDIWLLRSRTAILRWDSLRL